MDISSIFIALILTLISGYADAQGFIHASNIWTNNNFVLSELLKSALGFSIGIVSYWFIVKYLTKANIISPEVQTLWWFVITLVGVALSSGHFFKWATIDQIVAFLTLLGVGWLMLHVSI